MARLVGLIRLVHPFPSALDAVLTGVLVRIAGGGVDLAIRLGIAMLAIQFGIGALNDLVDAPRDAGRKRGKPIPRGLVPAGVAAGLAIASMGLGLLLTLGVSPAVFAVGAAGTACGVAYDLWLKRSVLSWLPWALGIPLLPVFAWLGATGGLPAPFVALVPVGVLAGSAIAIGNGLADVERDAAAGTGTIAVRLGTGRAWRLAAVLYGAVAAGAIVTVVLFGGRGTGPIGLLGAACAVLGLGVGLGRGGTPSRRERAWELQTIGVGLIGAGWLWALVLGGAV